ncbi:MAG TPA: hypothetical protein VFA78_06735 [Chloroflexota bacterium]|nr:hypothetical protein [Chloroflexota bacterium]
MTHVTQHHDPIQASQSQTRIEYVMLCDSAQTSQDGKLYVLGGGWSQIARIVPPEGSKAAAPPTQFAVAASFLVDWNDANRPIGIRVAIEPDDEGSPIYEAQAQITASRPSQIAAGDPLRVVIAIPILMNFPKQGRYRVRARMEGVSEDVVVRFRVSNMQMMVPTGNPN